MKFGFVAAVVLPAASAVVGCVAGFEDFDAQRAQDAAGESRGCAPGDVKECPCPGGGGGTQTCSHDGSKWGGCEGCAASGSDIGPVDGGADSGVDDASLSDAGAEPSEDAGPDAGAVDSDPADGSSPDDGFPDGGAADSGAVDGGSFDGGIPDSGVADGGTGEPPTHRAPCEAGSCWLNAPALTGRCGTSSVREDFSTGKYNVHRFPLSAPGGVDVEITLEATGGSWNPALIVLATDGTTLYDGERALAGNPVDIQGIASGRGAGPAKVRINAQVNTSLHVFVTSWDVVDGGFVPAMPTNATYMLTVFADCPLPEAVCPMDPGSITKFGSGYFTASDSDDPNSPNYSPYKRDYRTSHSGYDLNAPLGTPVYATESGTIVSSETSDIGWCNMPVDAPGLCGRSINLAADSGVTFRYCHLDKVLVTSGYVQAGQLIAENGDSGNACAPHVHFAYLDGPGITGAGTDAQKSEKVNQYIDNLCR